MNRVSKLTFVATACLAVMGGSVFAQDPAPDPTAGDPAAPPPPSGAAAPAAAGGKGSKIIGVDAAVILPLSDYADLVTLGLGVLGRFEFGVNDTLAITGRVGFVYNVIKSDFEGFSLNFVPIYAGAKYKIGTSGLFAFGEVGLTYTLATIDVGGVSASDSEINLGLTAGAGYQMGKISLRGNLLLPDIGETGVLGIMASFGYDLTSL